MFDRAILFCFFLLLYLLRRKEEETMDNSEKKVVLSVKKDEDNTFKLKIIKKRIPSKAIYLKDDMGKNYLNLINQLSFFYKFFETRIAIRKGDVFVVRFSFGCGNELSGDHFVAALLDSSPLNPMVTVVPLKSSKGRPLNPASDIFVGKIDGIENGKDSIAVINQLRTIDKRRMFNAEIVKHLESYLYDKTIPEYQEIEAQDKHIYRLTAYQYQKVHDAVCEYVYNGYIRHD